jgi:glycosyltransferase involved in cell wall biosynthesis
MGTATRLHAFIAPPAGTGVRVAIFSTFPPTVCGVGDYADQQAARFERDGHTVDRIDLEALRAHGWTKGAVADVSRRMATADRVVVHYQVWLFRDRTKRVPLSHLTPRLALLRLMREHGARTEIVVHDVRSWTSSRLKAGQVALARATFAKAQRIVVHTPQERAAFVERYGDREGIEVRPHTADLVARTSLDRPSARRKLGLPASGRLFLCIGFYTPAKGFEAFAADFEALARAGGLRPDDQLHIVASVREPDDRAGHAALAALASHHSGAGAVRVHPHYAAAEEFDTWLAACDWVVLPYEASYTASSGVAARAALMGRPVLATGGGGLQGQARPGDVLVANQAGLRDALRAIAAR